MFRDSLADDRALDVKDVDKVLKSMTPAAAGESCYFVGWFLELRGRTQDARLYYDRCTQSLHANVAIRTLAACAIRERSGASKP